MDPLTFLGVFVAIALGLVIVGKAKDWEIAEYRKHGIQTQGIVLRNELCIGRNSVMRPVVRFTTQ